MSNKRTSLIYIFSFEKTFEIQTKAVKDQTIVLKSFYNKINDLKQVDDIFPKSIKPIRLDRLNK